MSVMASQITGQSNVFRQPFHNGNKMKNEIAGFVWEESTAAGDHWLPTHKRPIMLKAFSWINVSCQIGHRIPVGMRQLFKQHNWRVLTWKRICENQYGRYWMTSKLSKNLYCWQRSSAVFNICYLCVGLYYSMGMRPAGVMYLHLA